MATSSHSLVNIRGSNDSEDAVPTLFHGMTLEADQKEFAKSDTLDVKAGILLALVAVLVTINGTLLADSHLTKWLQVAQLCSLVIAGLAALLASISLFPRGYDLPTSSSAYNTWLAEIEKLDLSEAVTAIEKTAVREAWPRIRKNSRINGTRLMWLFFALLAAIVSLGIDFIALGASAVDKIRS
jgi:hypothetical protein